MDMCVLPVRPHKWASTAWKPHLVGGPAHMREERGPGRGSRGGWGAQGRDAG